MTDKANELLSKLRAEYESTHKTSFDNTFYIGYSDDVLTELHNNGSITVTDDLIGSIVLDVK